MSKNTALTELSCYNNQLKELDVSKNLKLKELHCDNNQMTVLDVSKNKELLLLNCNKNQLTTLILPKRGVCNSLDCSMNQIKGKSMDVLVESLPNVSEKQLKVIFIINEQNKMSRKQVAAAKAKGWIPQ